jgi:ABC-type nitrate/sulfonate/bicarbonate transport system ATPase subunit
MSALAPMKGQGEADWGAHVDHLLDVTGLCDFKDKAIYELSGGMQQRVPWPAAWPTIRRHLDG